MVCADTNCWRAYFGGESGKDVDALRQALESKSAWMIPVVLAELLSAPGLAEVTELAFLTIPLLDLLPGYWCRTGKTRASLLKLGYRPKLADTLIAQTCIDHEALLLSRDRDFSAFRKHCHLKLLP